MEKKLDLRVQKTRSALTNALYDLMCQKNLDEITVTELCEKAVVRKATFYKHFGDKTEVLVYMIQELQRLSEENNIIGYDPGNPSSYYTGVFRYLMDFIDNNEHFIVRQRQFLCAQSFGRAGTSQHRPTPAAGGTGGRASVS